MPGELTPEECGAIAGYEIMRQGNKKMLKPWEALNNVERTTLMRVFNVAFSVRDRRKAEADLKARLSGEEKQQ